ncbi:MAG: DUF3887 domain-containing protein [Cyanobacteria bacterium]|nr:DUF3887 domain-containing protein [Cyanobacteria bacterium CG_2015-16_32_12]NCO78673.1 DUF3887 domain-containing protein [Cyanobacteria bacterium CG_2015-22_32_23]NCQ05446.1 DUF3887 domain-containing protein [Cyanobacteria bacterium CG_2015-09_32_10]NCQ42992.1 DUF3887 domain-containing protein [Cyanobacteria bacterium CG_2015-04_32_10]NCS83332.1 DUF3887 domain-containing protein [Cyanobacteria bacterium CG_2015-02_32_10]
MKISRFIAISTISLILGGLSYQTSSYAEKTQTHQIIAQSNNEEKSPQLEAKAKEVINLFFTEKFDSVSQLFTPDLRSEIPLKYMKSLLTDTLTQNGKFQKLTDSKVIVTPGSDLVVLTLNFEKITEDWIVIFNDQQEVIGVDIPTNKNIETIATEFINSLVSQESAQARGWLNPFLKETILPQQLQSRWNSFIQGKGDFKGITKTTVRNGSKGDNTDVVIMDLEFSQKKEKLFVIFDSSKSIIGVDFIQ